MVWHADITVDVITKICEKAEDVVKLPKRISTVRDTYAKGDKGLKIASTTEFINLVKHVTGCNIEEAENVIGQIKFVWRVDAPGPELKQPIIIGLGGNRNKNKNKNKNKRNTSNKNNDNDDTDNYSDIEPNFPPPSNAEILYD